MRACACVEGLILKLILKNLFHSVSLKGIRTFTMMMELAGSFGTVVHIYKTIWKHISGNYNGNMCGGEGRIYGWNSWKILDWYMVHSCTQFSLGIGLAFSKEWWRETLRTHHIRSGADTHITFSQWWVNACLEAFLRHYEEVLVIARIAGNMFACLRERVVDRLGGIHSAPPIGVYFTYCIFSRDYFVFVNALKNSVQFV
jgi:hypothetical protein